MNLLLYWDNISKAEDASVVAEKILASLSERNIGLKARS